MPLGGWEGEYKISNLWEGEEKIWLLSLFAPHHGMQCLSSTVQCYIYQTEKRLVIVIIPTLGYFFVLLFWSSLFVGGEDHVACLLAAQSQGPGIMKVHYTYKILWCIPVGLLILLPLLETASTVTTSQLMPCRSSSFLVPSFIRSVGNWWIEEESTPDSWGASDVCCRSQCPLMANW